MLLRGLEIDLITWKGISKRCVGFYFIWLISYSTSYGEEGKKKNDFELKVT